MAYIAALQCLLRHCRNPHGAATHEVECCGSYKFEGSYRNAQATAMYEMECNSSCALRQLQCTISGCRSCRGGQILACRSAAILALLSLPTFNALNLSGKMRGISRALSGLKLALTEYACCVFRPVKKSKNQQKKTNSRYPLRESTSVCMSTSFFFFFLVFALLWNCFLCLDHWYGT